MVSYSLIQKYILDNLGLKYNTNQEDELYSKLSDASSSFGYDDTDDFIIWLLQQRTTKDIAEKLSSFLTIGETYFVREKKALDFLEFDFLPKLIKNRKEKNQTLRIWSVGCSSGEEPYSVAIILRRLIPNIADWQIRIDGSDINPKFLNKAIKGEYSSWSFRGTSDHFKELNFIRTSVKTFQIKKEIRDMVTFSYVNIADELFYLDPTNFSKYDVILCRNVLIYFSKPGIERVSKRFYQSLNTDGVFIVSPVEASNLISKNFSRETYEGVTIYRNSPEKIITDSKPANKSNKIESNSDKKEYLVSGTDQYFSSMSNVSKVGANVKNYPLKKNLTRSSLKNNKSAEKIVKSNLIKEVNIKEIDLLTLARLKANSGQLVEAEALCRKAISIDSVNEIAYYLHATILDELGRKEEAINSINKSLFLKADFALGYFFLGNIAFSKKNREGGVKHFQVALKCLEKLDSNHQLEESDGITVGRLSEIIKSIL